METNMAPTKTRKPANQQKKKQHRWTEAQIKTLRETVDAARTTREGLEKAAKKLGRSPATTQYKYYELKRKASTKKPRAATPAKKRTTTNPALANLTVPELVALAKSVRTEIDNRQAELETARKALR
jgi:hypothetical protein